MIWKIEFNDKVIISSSPEAPSIIFQGIFQYSYSFHLSSSAKSFQKLQNCWWKVYCHQTVQNLAKFSYQESNLRICNYSSYILHQNKEKFPSKRRKHFLDFSYLLQHFSYILSVSTWNALYLILSRQDGKNMQIIWVTTDGQPISFKI